MRLKAVLTAMTLALIIGATNNGTSTVNAHPHPNIQKGDKHAYRMAILRLRPHVDGIFRNRCHPVSKRKSVWKMIHPHAQLHNLKAQHKAAHHLKDPTPPNYTCAVWEFRNSWAARCVRDHEAAYDEWTNPTYDGAYQADDSFEAAYGREFVARWGHMTDSKPDWPAWAQDTMAYRGHARRGWSPWPTFARYCS